MNSYNISGFAEPVTDCKFLLTRGGIYPGMVWIKAKNIADSLIAGIMTSLW